MDADAEQIIGAELEPGERLIWSGRPRRGLLLHREDALYLPLGLYVAVITLATSFLDPTDASHSQLHANSSQPPYFVIVIISGLILYWAFANLLIDARLRSTSLYGLTNERVIIVTRLLRSIVSFPLRGLHDLTLMQGSSPDGRIEGCRGARRSLCSAARKRI